MFPRLSLTTGEALPADMCFRVGDEFARVDAPNDTSLNPLFRTWRMVKWQVVAHRYQRWNIDRGEYEAVMTTAFRVVDERPLDTDEIEWWSAWVAEQEAV